MKKINVETMEIMLECIKADSKNQSDTIKITYSDISVEGEIGVKLMRVAEQIRKGAHLMKNLYSEKKVFDTDLMLIVEPFHPLGMNPPKELRCVGISSKVLRKIEEDFAKPKRAHIYFPFAKPVKMKHFLEYNGYTQFESGEEFYKLNESK